MDKFPNLTFVLNVGTFFFFLQFIWIHRLAHGHVRRERVLLEAVQSQLLLHIWFQARNRVGLPASHAPELCPRHTSPRRRAFEPRHATGPQNQRLQRINRAPSSLFACGKLS